MPTRQNHLASAYSLIHLLYVLVEYFVVLELFDAMKFDRAVWENHVLQNYLNLLDDVFFMA
jgi:hypothetical protein